MAEPFDVASGRWWRFDRYEVRDGYVRPRAGAELETYDVWEGYRAAKTAGSTQEPPYASLLGLVQALNFRPVPGPGPVLELTPESEASLLEWCSGHGLLGILLQRTQMVTLAPRWAPLETLTNRLIPTLFQHFRTNDGWVTGSRWRHAAPLYPLVDQPEMEGELVPTESLPSSWPGPGAVTQSLRTIELKQEPLFETWARFFPDVPREEHETYPYPRPLSEQFWRRYAEPIYDLVEAAKLLLTAARNLTSAKAFSKASEDDLQRVGMGMEIIHKLAGPVSPALRPLDDGSFRQEWVAPSLLGAFAMMQLLDITERHRLLRCETCGKFFLSKAYQARYCSDTCRHTAQKRRYRQRKRKTNTPNGGSHV